MEKLHLYKMKTVLVKIKTLIEDNHLLFPTPEITQFRSYIYSCRNKLLVENYPEVRQYLTEITKKTFHETIPADETFYIYSNFSNWEASILFSTKAFLENATKQSQIQPSFVHMDSTFKLIDLGLPLMIISTETIHHNLRPIVFYFSWSESIS